MPETPKERARRKQEEWLAWSERWANNVFAQPVGIPNKPLSFWQRVMKKWKSR